MGIGGVKALDVRKEHQKIRPRLHGNDRGKRIVIAHGDLRRGNGIVFIDDRQYAKLYQAVQGIGEIFISLFIFNIVTRQKDLTDVMPILRELLIVHIHQLALADRGGRLLRRHILRALGKAELTDTHADRARGNEDHLVTCVF